MSRSGGAGAPPGPAGGEGPVVGSGRAASGNRVAGPHTVVLLGPAGAGKSTVGPLLADLISKPIVDLDAVAPSLHAEAGTPLGELGVRVARDGYPAAHRWFQAGRVHAVVGVLGSHLPAGGAVLAFGAGHSHFEDRVQFDRVRATIAGRRSLGRLDVVLLLPFPETDRSVQVLRARCLARKGHGWDRDGVDYLREWCESDQNSELADEVVFDLGRPPMEVAREIEDRLRRRGPG